MAVHAISFRIENTGNYSERWGSVVHTIRSEAKEEMTWEETTSFFVIESNKSANDLASAIYLNSLMAQIDLLLVVNLSLKEHAVRGTIKYDATLNYLMGLR